MARYLQQTTRKRHENTGVVSELEGRVRVPPVQLRIGAGSIRTREARTARHAPHATNSPVELQCYHKGAHDGEHEDSGD